MKKLFALPVALFAFACSSPGEAPVAETTQPPTSAVVAFEEIEVPAIDGAGQPHVVPDGSGGFLMSWTEPDGERFALKMARYSGGSWSESRVIASRDDLFVNWADFPSIAVSGDAMYAHWLQRSAPGTYDYDVMMSISGDGGDNWGDPFVVHNDGVKAEHGFVSLLPLPDSRVGISWLDGREMAGGHDDAHGDMGVRYAEVGPDGSITDESLLDSRTCECCTTTITATPDGPLVAWRDRSDTEVRDIWFSRRVGSEWSEPALLHDDGWEISGCPVNGPQADASGDRIAIAWYTMAGGKNKVRVAFSDDGGASFSAPVEVVAREGVVGYVDTLFVADDRALVIWMEDRGDRLELDARVVSSSGELGDEIVVTSTTRGRTGFPRMARSGDEIILAWNEKGDTPRIHVARATISN